MTEPNSIQRGMKFRKPLRGSINPLDHVCVMAVADGYAMVRRSGCAPFAMRLKDLAKLERLNSTNNGAVNDTSE